MAFIQSIYDKKEEYFERFASEFFHKDFWKQLSKNDPKISAFFCAFYTLVKSRCNLDDNEASKIVYQSLKKKCVGIPSYNNFKEALDENLNKIGSESFSNKDIETSMSAFEALYLQWEMKMANEGFIS